MYSIKIHYHKANEQWSVHYRGKCYLVDELHIGVPCQTKVYKEQKYNPKAFIRAKGWLIKQPDKQYYEITSNHHPDVIRWAV